MVAINASVYAQGSEAELEDGELVVIKMNAASGAAPSLNIGQLGALPLVDELGVALPTGALVNGQTYILTYMGGNLVYNNAENRTPIAIVATADGLTTGIVPAGARFISVTSASANNIVRLPASVIGKKIEGWVGANGCEIRSVVSPATTINNVVSGDTTEAAIPASSFFILWCVAADAWLLHRFTNLGAVGTAIVPDAV